MERPLRLETPGAGSGGPPARFDWPLLGAIAALTALRLAVAAGIGLGDAEAFYWVYSRHLAAGYLEHPPGVAFLIRLGTLLLGDTPLGVRLPSILCSAGSLWLAAGLARRLSGQRRAGRMAAAILALTPVFAVGSISAAPDAGAAFLWLLALDHLVRLLQGGRGLHALGCGAAIGLAFLMKYFAVLFVPAALAALAMTPRGRALLRRPAVYAGAALALLVASPVLLWNAQHGWASLLNRFVWQQGAAGFSLHNVGALLGGQAAYLTPLVFGWLLAMLVPLWRRRATDPAAAALLAASAVPLGLAYLVCAWTPRAEPHWPVWGTLALVVAAACWWDRTPSRAGRRFASASLALAGAALLALHVMVLTPVLPAALPADLYVPRYDLANELVGWDAAGARALELRGRLSRPGAPPPLLVSYHYTLCGQLAFAVREDVRCLNRRTDDFDFFPAEDPLGRDAIVVHDDRYPRTAPELYRFDACAEEAPLPILRGGRVVRTFRFWACRGFRGLQPVSGT